MASRLLAGLTPVDQNATDDTRDDATSLEEFARKREWVER
jgi:hypothetical protein